MDINMDMAHIWWKKRNYIELVIISIQREIINKTIEEAQSAANVFDKDHMDCIF